MKQSFKTSFALLAAVLAAGSLQAQSNAVITIDGSATGADVTYTVATNSAAGVDTNANNDFGGTSNPNRLRVADNLDTVYLMIDGTYDFSNKFGIFIDSDANAATGVGPGEAFPAGTLGETNNVASLFNAGLANGGWETALFINRNAGGNNSFVTVISYDAAGAVAGENFIGSGTAAGGSLAGTVRGNAATVTYANNNAGGADNGLEIAIPKAWLLSNGRSGSQLRVAVIGGNGGFDFLSANTIPQVAAQIGNAAGAGSTATAALTAPVFNYTAGFTGAGTYTVGPGGNYATLASFLDDALKVRELSGLITVASTTVTGVGTQFLSEVAVGDRILTSTGAFRGTAQVLTVTAIASDTSLTVSAAPSVAITTSLKATRQKPAFPVTLTGNVTALITGNITETVNSMVLYNSGGFSFTIKPAPTVRPTITFARAEDQQGFTGNLIVGTNNAGANAVIAGTDNFVIDGSNTVAGTTRDLTIQSAMTYASSVPVHVNGDADNAVIKNVIINNNGTSTGTNTSAIRFTQLQYAAGATDFTAAGYAAAGTYVPDGFIVDNCELNALSVSQGHGVNATTLGTVPAGTGHTNFQIINNDINANIRGVFLNGGYAGGLVRNNNVYVRGVGFSGDTFGVIGNSANGQSNYTITVDNNIFDISNTTNVTTTAFGAHGVFLGTLGTNPVTANIDNNTIITRHSGTAGTAGTIQRGIRVSSGITNFNVRHNSILIADNPNQTYTAITNNVYGIGGLQAAPVNVNWLNNNVWVNEQFGSALQFQIATTTTLVINSNENNLFAPVIFNGNATTSFGTLAAWQGSSTYGSVASTRDTGSTSVDPTGAVSAADLHFISAPAASFIAPAQVGSITVDIDGDARSSTPTVGADEFTTNTAPTAVLATAVAGVAENAATGALITVASGVDANINDYPTIAAAVSAGTATVTRTGLSTYRVNLASALDFETNPTVSVTLTASDRAGQTFVSAPIVIPVTNVNEAPTAVGTVAAATVAENAANGTVVATLTTSDPDAGDTFVYTLVAGTGDTNNGLFTIVGNQLRVNAPLNFETLGANLTVRVQSQDQNGTGLTVAAAIPVTLTNVNEAPANITLNPSAIDENSAVGTTVGTLTATDDDSTTITFALTSGAGDTNNGLFSVSGNQVQSAAALDFEVLGSPLSIRVLATDDGGTTAAAALNITLNNLPDTASVQEWTVLND